LIRKYEWVVPQRKVIGQAYNIGLQIVPAMIGSVVLDLVDRALLDSMSDRYQLGLYGISYQFALLMTLLCIGVAKTITPYIHQAQFDSDSFGRVFRSRLAGGLLIFIGFGACAAYASGYFIELFFSQEYSGASSIAVILVLSYAINGVYAVLSPLAVKASLFRALSYSTLFAVVVNIVCNIALIPTLGAIGAAIATLISFVFRSGLLLFLVWQKLDSLNAPQESLN
jgi:O-antigen/teichoic acid export membrane protein